MLLKTGVVMMTFALAFAAVVAYIAFNDEPMERAVAAKSAAEPTVEPLVRHYLPPEPEKAERPEPELASRPEPEPERRVLPVGRDDWPMPTEGQIEAASQPRYYDLPPGAIMGLTIEAIGLYDVPVFDSDSQWALDNGVGHVPETSLPWSRTPQRNVYLAGHRLGWPGTWSHLVFYNLNQLGRGDEVILRGRDGRRYRYRVTEAFVAEPQDSWVMGQVRGRDMVTLQTCTPIPVFDERLIVRADRV